MQFADILLPVPLPGLFTYRVPEKYKARLKTGIRVVVLFGPRKLYSGIVYKLHNNPPEGYTIKDIIDIVDNQPVVNSIQLKFWDWMAQYYMCTPGEVCKAALPSGLKLESETRLYLNRDKQSGISLDHQEELLLDLLKRKTPITIKDISKQSGISHPARQINKLITKGLITAEERIKETYRRKTIKYIKLTEAYRKEEKINQAIEKLKQAPKQKEVLLKFLDLSDAFKKGGKEISQAELIKSAGKAGNALLSLIKRGFLMIYEKETERHERYRGNVIPLKKLTRSQDFALKKIRELFIKKDVVLLHGVTSSGKTEIYIHLIDEQIKKGKKILYLLPEIALTAQIINRLRKVFGDAVGIYHSRFSDAERIETYHNMLKRDGRYSVILGVRSSVFLPFENLGLIIVDEEHENTYKQFEPAPRYHARDSVIMLAGMHNAKVILGSATPSVESYFNARNNKYGLVELGERFRKLALPEIKVVNIREAYRKKQMKSYFSDVLLNGIGKTLSDHKQVILFQNRKGFSLYLQCDSCGWIPCCRNCDVSLTYHKNVNKLVCHYCGYSKKIPDSCDDCQSPDIKTRGFGTEKIEDETGIFFPGYKVARLDLESAKTRKHYEQIIEQFESGKIDILVGTQMLSKGLDFDNVGLVGVLDADNMLNFPDFRAFERSYQLMAQVAGRAGRKGEKGIVILQTADPEHIVIRNVIRYDYFNMYKSQIADRYRFHYPPYNRLIILTIKHRNKDILRDAATRIANDLKAVSGLQVLGPQSPLVGRIQRWYVMNVSIKLSRERPLGESKKHISGVIHKYQVSKSYGALQITPDVDPM